MKVMVTEDQYLTNLIVFGADLRVVTTETLRARWNDPEATEVDKRLLFLSIHQQFCLSLEDVGALMYAVEQAKMGDDFLRSLTGYRGTSAYLYQLIGAKSDETITSTYGYGPPLPSIYSENGITAKNIADDAEQFVRHLRSVANVQQDRMDICNKLKHGATIYNDPKDYGHLSVVDCDSGDVVLATFSYTQKALDTYCRQVATCSFLLREMAFRYLAERHDQKARELLEDDGFADAIAKSCALINKYPETYGQLMG